MVDMPFGKAGAHGPVATANKPKNIFTNISFWNFEDHVSDGSGAAPPGQEDGEGCGPVLTMSR